MLHRRLPLALVLLPIAAVACAASSNNNSFSSSSGKTTHGATTTAGAGGASTSTGVLAGAGGAGGAGTGTASTGSGQGGAGPSVMYAHTGSTLFSMDPTVTGLPLTQIGDFDCIGGNGQDSSMTDFAVNSAGDMWGVSISNVYHLVVQGSVVHCQQVIPLNNASGVKFYALSFAPVGVLDPMKEVLIAGNSAGELWAIDTTVNLGALSQHGTLGTVPAADGQGHSFQYPGGAFELSGDIVFLLNNGSPVGFATVRDCPNPPSSSGCNTTDTLIQINLSMLAAATTGSVSLGIRGQVVKAAGCADPNNSGYGSMFGIAAWGDKVYGFSHTGDLVDISNVDGTACLIQNYPNNIWDGAGVSTRAPVTPPPPLK